MALGRRANQYRALCHELPEKRQKELETGVIQEPLRKQSDMVHLGPTRRYHVEFSIPQGVPPVPPVPYVG